MNPPLPEHAPAPTAPDWDEAWVRALPKAEVHCHLEGCIERDLVARAAARRRVGLPWQTAGGDWRIRNLADLLAYLDFSCALLDTADELAEVAFAASRHATASGVRHLDLIVNPNHWRAWHGRLSAMVDAFDAGCRQAESDGLAPVALCLSVNRQEPASVAGDLVDWMISARHPRVVALSIDGNELLGSNNGRFADAFARAGAHGFRRCAHAGESSGPEGVRGALEILGAERIDHGVRAVEDPDLVVELASRAVPLDVCPGSNCLLGVTPSLAEHPIDRLRRAGVRVSINTDDPLVYGSELAGEYVATGRTFGWGRAELAAVARTSIESSFADEDRKAAMLADLRTYLVASGTVVS